MSYLEYCLDYWNKGGIVNWIILFSTFFVTLCLVSKNFTRGFANIIIGVIPLLGLLGTVVGMIDTFTALQQTSANVQGLSAGISKAMITTGSGLFIAIIGTIALHYKEDHNFNPQCISYGDPIPTENESIHPEEAEQHSNQEQTLCALYDTEQQFYDEYPVLEIYSPRKKKCDQNQIDHQQLIHAHSSV